MSKSIDLRQVAGTVAGHSFPDCEQCFSCERSLYGFVKHEHDHFPIPFVAGGTTVVSACLLCHDLKDRYGQDQWHPEMFRRASDEIAEALKDTLWIEEADGKITLKTEDGFETNFGAFEELFAHLPAWETVWDELGTYGRLIYGRWLAFHHTTDVTEKGHTRQDEIQRRRELKAATKQTKTSAKKAA